MNWLNNWPLLSIIDHVCYMMLYIVTYWGEGKWHQKENRNCSVLASSLKICLNLKIFWKSNAMKLVLPSAAMNLFGGQCWPTFGSWKTIGVENLTCLIGKFLRKSNRGVCDGW